jgi:hypothetical protein
MKLIVSITLTFIFLFSVSLYAQEDLTVSDQAKAKAEKKEAKNAKRAEKIAQGKFLISPLAAPGYTPELGGLVAIGGLMSFKTNPADDKIQRSSLPVTLGYTTTGAIVANGILTSYWFADKMRVYGQFWYKDMPDNYWGIGYENGFNVQNSDSTTAYQRKWWWFNPSFLWQFKQNLFLGLNVDYEFTQGSKRADQLVEDYNQGVGSDPNYIEYNDKPLNSGFGIILQYDSRDVPVDTRTGFYFNLTSTFYSTAFGGDNKYQMYLIDYRQAVQLSQTMGENTLVWQVKSRITSGEVSYGAMSQLGTPFDLRGYTWGQYRDKDMFFFLAEYRHVFKSLSGELGKHGVVTWVGSGTIFDFDTLKENNNKWLPNFGVGYRLELQPRMWMRLDFGIGRQTSGIYFNFNQAF